MTKKRRAIAEKRHEEEMIGTGIFEEVLPEDPVSAHGAEESAAEETLEAMYIPDITFSPPEPAYGEEARGIFVPSDDHGPAESEPAEHEMESGEEPERREARGQDYEAADEQDEERREPPGEEQSSSYIIEEAPSARETGYYYEDWSGSTPLAEPRLKAIQLVLRDHLMKGSPIEFPMYSRDEDMVEIARLITQIVERHRVSRRTEPGGPVDGRIAEIVDSLEKVTRGYLKIRVPFAEDADTVGSLAKHINDMVEAYDKLKENTKGSFMMDMIEELQNTRDYLLERVNHILRALDDFSSGKTEVRVEVTSTEDPIGLLSRGINDMIESLNEREQQMKAITQELATGLGDNFEVLKKFSMEGNLTVRAPENPNNQMLQSLADVVNTTLERFREIVKEFSEGITQIESSASDILKSTEEQSAGLAHQSAGMSESTATITELSLTSAQIADHANLAMKLATQSLDKANQGQTAVNAALTGTEEISDSTEAAAKKILSLGEKSQAIGEVVDIIDDIAEQTNLLALNAAIEAARAGDAGRGFAVVASEIRKLAENVVGSTKEIKTLIKEIQNHTNASVMAMEEVTKKVNRGSALSRDVRESLGEIFKMVEETAEAAKQITLTTQQQKSASEQIVKTMEEMTLVARDSATNIGQVTGSVKDLNKLSEKMKQLMDQFKL
jgi:methyl-accepting chemotaxis protein